MSWIKRQIEDYKYNVSHGSSKVFYRITTALVVLLIAVLAVTLVISAINGVNPFQFGNMLSK